MVKKLRVKKYFIVLIKKYKIMANDMTNIELEKYSDYLISARSSSTLEYGTNGKRICCFPSPFSSFPFVKFAKIENNF